LRMALKGQSVYYAFLMNVSVVMDEASDQIGLLDLSLRCYAQ